MIVFIAGRSNSQGADTARVSVTSPQLLGHRFSSLTAAS